jgi:hypothetical protein
MASALRTASRFALSARTGVALLVIISACAAAIIAHVGIDVLGDYLLPHDTYDEIGHSSRGAVSCIALLAIVGAAYALFSAALADARDPNPRRSAASAVRPGRLAAFLAIVIVAAFACVAGMELADLRLAGRSADDIADLLGGSVQLGGVITLAAATVSGLVSWRLARWAAVAREVAARVLASWFVARDRCAAPAHRANRQGRVHVGLLPLLTRSTSKRGPPHNR